MSGTRLGTDLRRRRGTRVAAAYVCAPKERVLTCRGLRTVLILRQSGGCTRNAAARRPDALLYRRAGTSHNRPTTLRARYALSGPNIRLPLPDLLQERVRRDGTRR
eukprot:2323171-Rhodomonas_salina.5